MNESNNTMPALANPQGNLETAQSLVKFVNARRDEVLAEIEACAAKVNADNYATPEVAAEVKRLKEVVEDLRDKGKKLVAEVCAATEAQRVLTAIDSRLWSYSTKADPACAYAKLDAAFKALKGKVDELKAAALPPEPVHSYVVRMTCTDKALAAVMKAAQKAGVSDLYAASAQSDKAVKDINKWFEANA